MKKGCFYLSVLALGLMFSTTSCSDDDSNGNDSDYMKLANLDYSADNADNWGKYMVQVTNRLKKDASDLYDDWNTKYGESNQSYAELFKNPGTPGNSFGSYSECVQQLVEGCWDIANEVGTAKIGDPYDLYVSGDTEKALFAVESWYSWHSREDYCNNIYSIRNAYYGSRDGKVAVNSLSKAIAAVDPELDKTVTTAIEDAAEKILAIPTPFRNNINSSEAFNAMRACVALGNTLTNELKPAATDLDEDILEPIIKNYVDVVVLPTYTDLKKENSDLYDAVVAFQNAPSQVTMDACSKAWLDARIPWETSEAFLFGPVADMGLDPNMDSWPLDQNGIIQVLTKGDFSGLDWNGSYDEDDANIAQVQSLRGYHTLEFLIFKDGKARSIK